MEAPKTGGYVSILFDGIFTESERARTVNTTTHTKQETL